MLLNFQRQFARPVWSGQKRQTIRAAGARAHVPKVGDTAYCYTGLRTRSTVKLGEWPINRVDVLRMDIGLDGLSGVILGANAIRHSEFTALALADGFKSGKAMADWFLENHQRGEFYGWVIGWDWSPVPPIMLPFESRRSS